MAEVCRVAACWVVAAAVVEVTAAVAMAAEVQAEVVLVAIAVEEAVIAVWAVVQQVKQVVQQVLQQVCAVAALGKVVTVVTENAAARLAVAGVEVGRLVVDVAVAVG